MEAAVSSVVRRVEELGDLAQAHIQQLSEAAGEDDHFLIRASAALEKLKLLCGEEKEGSNASSLLELYTQAILDMTYFEENKLVDDDFPEDSSSQKVKELISFLSEPEILVKENNIHPKHCDLLGDELLECLSWRRGALLYMYCHSLTKRREWLLRKSNLLKKYLVDGINYLLQMLNYRCPLQLNEGVSFQDLDTAKLLSAVSIDASRASSIIASCSNDRREFFSAVTSLRPALEQPFEKFLTTYISLARIYQMTSPSKESWKVKF
ncbi:PREDICTED: UPF0600 protein C5orf51 homolog isoform X3 [Chinchilla lanigera]|uniref:UPF0600 protein C5orf51 homolog isoform X3 n=1 Tax=Chinchilla lanigera TaxID=34839 RepID=UPI0006988819|nr:PREDICTED: UPF0600 protein C5orf51 homolog isoform X3 [Chinchilla lanigera]